MTGALLTLSLLSACASHTQAPAPAPVQLEGSRWELAVFTSMDESQPPLKPSEAGHYWLEFATDGRLMLGLDCNKGRSNTVWSGIPPKRPG